AAVAAGRTGLRAGVAPGSGCCGRAAKVRAGPREGPSARAPCDGTATKRAVPGLPEPSTAGVGIGAVVDARWRNRRQSSGIRATLFRSIPRYQILTFFA